MGRWNVTEETRVMAHVAWWWGYLRCPQDNTVQYIADVAWYGQIYVSDDIAVRGDFVARLQISIKFKLLQFGGRMTA
jgi:hypothetical protein